MSQSSVASSSHSWPGTDSASILPASGQSTQTNMTSVYDGTDPGGGSCGDDSQSLTGELEHESGGEGSRSDRAANGVTEQQKLHDDEGEEIDKEEEERKKKEMVERLLKRVEVGRAASRIQNRLAIATLKVTGRSPHPNGTNIPGLKSQELSKKRKNEDEDQGLAGPSAGCPGRSSKRPATGQGPVPSKSSSNHTNAGLFDHFLSPTRGPLPSRPNGSPYQSFPPNSTVSLPQSSVRHTAGGNEPVNGTRLRRSSVTSRQPSTITTSDPSFSAPEFVSAANALSSLSRGPSNPNVSAAAMSPPPSLSTGGWSRSPAARGPSKVKQDDDSDTESAAELMLFLAASPSPAQPPRKTSNLVLDGVKGRTLFNDHSDARPSSSSPSLRPSQRAGPSHGLGPPPDLQRNSRSLPSIPESGGRHSDFF